MERNELFKTINEGKIESVYLFSGPEAYVRRQAERNLIEKLIQPGMDMMNMNILVSPTVDQIMESADLFPFMNEYRLVIVRELPLLGKDSDKSKGKDDGEGKGKSRNSADDSDRLIEYLSHVPSTTCILFDSGDGFDKRKKVGKYLSGLPGCVNFAQLEGSELQKWIQKTVREHGASITAEAGERLVFLSGRDLTALNAEIEKLTAYAGDGGKIGENEVDLLATRTSEAQVFEMIDALFDGKTEEAFSQTDRLLKSGESRIGILALITRQIRQLLFAESMNQARRPGSDIAKAVGMSPYFLKKTLTRSGKIGIAMLRKCLDRCIQTDYDIKRGVLREEAGFERLMMEMATIAQRKTGKAL